MATGKKPTTSFYGPLKVGSANPDAMPVADNGGFVGLRQTAVITQNGTNVVSARFLMPPNYLILGFTLDLLVAFDSVTSATLSIGTSVGGTQFASGVNAKSTGRSFLTATAAQCAAMAANVTGNFAPVPVFATVTPVGATTVGSLRISVEYIMTE